MDKNESRAIATLGIWFGFALAIGLSNISNENPNVFSLLTAVIACLAAVVATAMVWQYGVPHSEEDAARQDKAKRDESGDVRLQALLQLLDDQERQALKSRLIGEVRADGEIGAIAEAIAPDEHEAMARHRRA
jgi:hypothetical protein